MPNIYDNLTHDSRLLDAIRTTSKGQATGKAIYHRFGPKPSSPTVGKINRPLAERYGSTDAELDSIINQDIKRRTGREG